MRYFAASSLRSSASRLSSLAAQDTRTVTEPKIPPACVTLEADVVANHGVIAARRRAKALHRPHSGRARPLRVGQRRLEPARSKAVVLRAHGKKNVFLTGPLTLRAGVTLVVEQNTALVASRDPRVYDLSPGGCGIVPSAAAAASRSSPATDAKNAGIMGEGSIDARGGAKLLGQDVTWWDLAHEAKVKDQQQSVPAMIALRHADNFILYKITLRNSPGFHVSVNQTDGFTAWGVKIMTPKTARNTDGIDPGSSRNITIAYSYIHTGDDDVCLKPSAAGAVSNMSVLHNHFYTGHGMSIGSGTYGGVDHLLVDDLTIDGADNGLRIKSDPSRGGLVHQVVYRNVCIRNVPNPLVFTPHYTTFTGDRLPIYHDITLENVHILTPGAYTFYGLDADHKLEIKLDNVFADDQKDSLFYDKDADITIGPRPRQSRAKGRRRHRSRRRPTPRPASRSTAMRASFRSLKTKPRPRWPAKFRPRTKPSTSPPTAPATTTPSSARSIWLPKPAAQCSPSRPASIAKCITVDKPNITIRSANPDASKTVVVNDRSAGQNGGTLHSATVNVTADNFFAENITFQNDFNRTHEQTPQGSQALALLVTGDRAIFHNVRLLGNQDTVYLGSRSCAQRRARTARPRASISPIATSPATSTSSSATRKAVFENCEIHSTPHDGGYITAQSKHYPDEDSGFVIDHSQAHRRSRRHRQRLSRPAVASLRNRHLYAHLRWATRSIPRAGANGIPDETHSLDTAYYAEFDSTGPGAHHDRARPAHALPHARRSQTIRADSLSARQRQLGSDKLPTLPRSKMERMRTRVQPVECDFTPGVQSDLRN